MHDSLSVAIPCRGNEPGLFATLASLHEACLHTELPRGLVTELLICINGIRPGDECAPLVAVREFCQQSGIQWEEKWINGHSETCAHLPSRPFVYSPHQSTPFDRCTILLTERPGKPPAWNTLWRWATGSLVLFSDADVRIDHNAVWALYTRIQHDQILNLVAAREVPVVQDGGTVWSRMGAIPYRFNFGNAGGRLLLLRKTVLPEGMPENLLLEDAWLTVAVGKTHVAKAMNARVFFVPPVTWRDYFAERVRTEGGKLQIVQEHGSLLSTGPIAAYRWSHFWRELSFREYPLVVLSQVIKGVARLWARLMLIRRDFYSLYRPFSSTKEWGKVQR